MRFALTLACLLPRGRGRRTRYARTTQFGGGLVRAENQIPFWRLSEFRTVSTIIARGLAQMWNQGPSGAHYGNMMDDYTEVGCGVFVNGDEVTVVQALR